jgi:hypothetical protein
MKMKKLTLQRETVRVLNHVDLANIHGGDNISVPQTTRCKVGSGGACSGGSCVETTTVTGTSVIDPGTSVIAPSGG